MCIFLHFVRKHDLPFCCGLDLEHSRQRRLIIKSILTFESIYTELNLVDIEITFAHTLVHISQKISNWSIIYTLNVILVTPGNNWPHLIGHLGATPPLQSLPACSLIHPSHRLSGTNTLISQHIVWLPKFLANMTNETFQACHLGIHLIHLAIAKMPQTVQPGQTRQTRLICFVFY